jgi:hypothetical protein
MGEEATLIESQRPPIVLAPGGVTHDFENRSDAPARALNLSVPGAFEPHMPSIVEWFAEHPAGDTAPTT